MDDTSLFEATGKLRLGMPRSSVEVERKYWQNWLKRLQNNESFLKPVFNVSDDPAKYHGEAAFMEDFVEIFGYDDATAFRGCRCFTVGISFMLTNRKSRGTVLPCAIADFVYR